MEELVERPESEHMALLRKGKMFSRTGARVGEGES